MPTKPLSELNSLDELSKYISYYTERLIPGSKAICTVSSYPNLYFSIVLYYVTAEKLRKMIEDEEFAIPFLSIKKPINASNLGSSTKRLAAYFKIDLEDTPITRDLGKLKKSIEEVHKWNTKIGKFVTNREQLRIVKQSSDPKIKLLVKKLEERRLEIEKEVISNSFEEIFKLEKSQPIEAIDIVKRVGSMLFVKTTSELVPKTYKNDYEEYKKTKDE